MTVQSDFNALITALEDNLQEKGISDATYDSTTGIMGLVAKILEIETGNKLDTVLTLSSSKSSIQEGETITLNGNLSVNFTGLNTVGFNLNTGLNNQTVKIYNDDTLIGSTTTNNNGEYTYNYTVSDSESLNVYSVFEGTGFFNECESSIQAITVNSKVDTEFVFIGYGMSAIRRYCLQDVNGNPIPNAPVITVQTDPFTGQVMTSTQTSLSDGIVGIGGGGTPIKLEYEGDTTHNPCVLTF